MTGWNKWKAAVYLAAIFAAGGVSGWVAATKVAKQKAFSPPRPDEIAASLRSCMYDRLKLSSEQKSQIDAVIERSSREVQSIHRDRTDRIRQSLSNRNSQIMGILRPEQQDEFELIEQERRESWRQKEAARNRNGSKEGRDGRKKEKEKNASAAIPATTNISASAGSNLNLFPILPPGGESAPGLHP